MSVLYFYETHAKMCISKFIEAYAANSQTLGISKDQLSGYTRSVSAYRLLNVYRQGRPVYLVDTPGFSDTSVAEIEIVNMVRKWLKEHESVLLPDSAN